MIFVEVLCSVLSFMQTLLYFLSSLVVQVTTAFVFVTISLYSAYVLALRPYLNLFKETKLSPWG